jgi:hypothetical protein
MIFKNIVIPILTVVIGGMMGYLIGDIINQGRLRHHVLAQIDWPYKPGEAAIGGCTSHQYGDFVAVCCPVWR